MPALSASFSTSRGLSGLALAAMVALQGCARTDEAALRDHLGQWFALGDTISFAAEGTCTAGLFRLVDDSIGAALPITSSPRQAMQQLASRQAIALDHDGVTPNRSLFGFIDADRTRGYQIRGAMVGAHACMDEQTESAFAHALRDDATIMAYDRDLGAVILMLAQQRLLVVAMGAG